MLMNQKPHREIILPNQYGHREPDEYIHVLISGEEIRVRYWEAGLAFQSYPCGRIQKVMWALEDVIGLKFEHDTYLDGQADKAKEAIRAHFKQVLWGPLFKKYSAARLQKNRKLYNMVLTTIEDWLPLILKECTNGIIPVYHSSYTCYWNKTEIQGFVDKAKAKIDEVAGSTKKIIQIEKEKMQWRHNSHLLKQCKRMLKNPDVLQSLQKELLLGKTSPSL